MTALPPYIPGQRWISTMEPELGLGVVLEADLRQVAVAFPAAQTQRRYALASAPLKRVSYQVGDTVIGPDNRRMVVETVSETGGLFTYHGEGTDLPEAGLAGAQAAESPLPRLLSGHVDASSLFSLRLETLRRRHAWLASPARGFSGCRVALIPHQLDVAFETASRPLPRVLLADEVGLGKTIEAGLIMHRLLLTGRISRVLIIVPEALTVQWFVELFRRFHLSFTLVGDHPLKEEIGATDDEDPFEPALCLAGLEGLLTHPKWTKGALETDWDLVCIDEAHHLDEVPGAQTLAAGLAQRSPGLLLLTATPESVGLEAHFGRLRLLDPQRYTTFKDYRGQRDHARALADLAARLLDQAEIDKGDKAQLTDWGLDAGKMDRDALVRALVDRHGEGRAVFRNTRHAVSGFPRREVHLHELKGDKDQIAAVNEECKTDLQAEPFKPTYDRDPRLAWLLAWLKKHPKDKALIIGRTPDKAEALAAALRRHVPVKTALFHERMSLLQRDRQAAWFADAEGARLLIASEIGGEGRNFQFAHHLIFWDCPADPERAEQRIGRLDRIGQRQVVHIHVPFVLGSGQEALARLLHEGLGAFGAAVAGGHALYLEFRDRLHAAVEAGDVSGLLEAVQGRAAEVAEAVHQGRDRLLELASHRPERAAKLQSALAEADGDLTFRRWAERLLDHFGVKAEPYTPETWHLDFALLNQPALPLPRGHEQGATATFDRALAQDQENWLFLTAEHPLVDAAASLLLESEAGNATVVQFREAGRPGLFLEAVFVLEAVAPPRRFVNRFLPPTPLHVCVDMEGEPVDLGMEGDRGLKTLFNPPLDNTALREKVRAMAQDAEAHAQTLADEVIAMAQASLAESLDGEIARLAALAQHNPAIHPEELRALLEEKAELAQAIGQARLRLDSLRLILPRLSD